MCASRTWKSSEKPSRTVSKSGTSVTRLKSIRIEGLISQHYPGAALNLNRTATKLCEDDRFWAMPTPEMGLSSLVSCFVLYGGGYHYLKQLALAERCESAFGLLKQRVSTALFSEFANCFMQMRKVSSTQEALALAIAINNLLKQAVDEEQQKQEQEKEQENGGSGDGDADESGDAGDGDADESGDAGDGDADESGEAGDGEPDESGEAGDGEPDESGEAGDGEPDESGEAVQNRAGSSRGNDQDLGMMKLVTKSFLLTSAKAWLKSCKSCLKALWYLAKKIHLRLLCGCIG